jgi:large subunit ribosomal protein L13
MREKKHVQQAAGEWHWLDAENKVLGRLATKIAGLLLGKHRLDFVHNKVAPVFVVVTNTNKVSLTGRKEAQKVYQHYTGYPGGLKTRSVSEQRIRDSRKIVFAAVYGMLPKNSLRDDRMNHLKLYARAEHPHQAQVPALAATGPVVV